MDTADKVDAVQDSPEMTHVAKMLLALYLDCDLTSFIRYAYRIDDYSCEITFTAVKTKKQVERFAHKKTVPFQECPICDGSGKILQDGFTSGSYQTCPTCDGKRIIPEYHPPAKRN